MGRHKRHRIECLPEPTQISESDSTSDSSKSGTDSESSTDDFAPTATGAEPRQAVSSAPSAGSSGNSGSTTPKKIKLTSELSTADMEAYFNRFPFGADKAWIKRMIKGEHTKLIALLGMIHDRRMAGMAKRVQELTNEYRFHKEQVSEQLRRHEGMCKFTYAYCKDCSDKGIHRMAPKGGGNYYP